MRACKKVKNTASCSFFVSIISFNIKALKNFDSANFFYIFRHLLSCYQQLWNLKNKHKNCKRKYDDNEKD